MTGTSTRRAGAGDGERIGEIFLAARERMRYLPRLHTDEQTRYWITEIMLPGSEVWVAEAEGRVVGFAALCGDRLDHLYVEPGHQNEGVGAVLLDRSRARRPDRLRLRVFVQNHGARRFYERHGFELISEGDGSGNEEHLPDALFEWRRRNGT